MNGYVYILESEATGKYCIGSTDNVDRRYKQHIEGKVYTTKRMLPVKLVLVQGFDTITFARQVEFKLKKLKRKDYIKKMVEEGSIKLGL